MAQYIEHLERELRNIDDGIAKAKSRLDDKLSGTSEKEKALEQLGDLKIRHDNLAERISEAKEKGADDWSSLRTGIQEELDGLRGTLENWLSKLS